MTLSQRIKERGLNVDDDGMVRLEGRMVGTFTTNLNLREFPFDSQELKVDLSSFQYGPEDVLFMDEGSNLREGLKITGWNIMGNETHTSGGSSNETSHYTHVIIVDRDET